MDQWKGKVAIVTGASAGIGAAIVEHLVKGGLTVVGTARRVDLIEQHAQRLQGERGRLIARQLDVCDEKGVLDTFEWVDSELGGAAHRCGYCCQQCSLHGHHTGPSTLGHSISRYPGFSLSIYPATKYAVTATSELLRMDIASMGYNIRVTSLSPGIVETELSTPVRTTFQGIPTIYPDDVAKCVCFILSMPPHVEIPELTVHPAPVAS